MLVVRVEVWPGGDGGRAFEISRLGLANVSQLGDVADYEITALTDRDSVEKVMKAEVLKHERSTGWMVLLRRTLTTLLLRDELTSPGAYDDEVAVLLRRGGHDTGQHHGAGHVGDQCGDSLAHPGP